ncbi:hypothetical protein A0H81_08330 [Grifola frondosa]|uniref:Uncharacterized protein n=1 Tax=Grifola frondosa TaxID=5627 RepID=A0A1C7M324_GRIFR|nr:hypothetical protein A0H81_08330 [Grifola frondosa]
MSTRLHGLLAYLLCRSSYISVESLWSLSLARRSVTGISLQIDLTRCHFRIPLSSVHKFELHVFSYLRVQLNEGNVGCRSDDAHTFIVKRFTPVCLHQIAYPDLETCIAEILDAPNEVNPHLN